MSVKLNDNCRKVLCLLSFMLLLQVVNAQYDFSGLEKKLEAAKGDIGKSYVCLIYKDGKVIYKKETEGFDTRAQASIGYASKWLTAALVMTFVDQGKLSLDDKVSTYIPIFVPYNKKFVTIRHCLSDLTGIQPGDGSPASLEEMVNNYASKRDIVTNTGTAFSYSNVGINIAARVCEIISKRGFEQLINDKIIRPCGMRNTSFFNNSGGSVNPASGGNSTASDYLNFLAMILNKGMFNGKRILSEASVEEMMKPQIPTGISKTSPKPVEGFNYATGCWIQEADAEGKAITVSAPGMFGTWPWVDICRNYAAIVFVKSNNGESNKLTYTSLKSFIDNVVGECAKK